MVIVWQNSRKPIKHVGIEKQAKSHLRIGFRRRSVRVSAVFADKFAVHKPVQLYRIRHISLCTQCGRESCAFWKVEGYEKCMWRPFAVCETVLGENSSESYNRNLHAFLILQNIDKKRMRTLLTCQVEKITASRQNLKGEMHSLFRGLHKIQQVRFRIINLGLSPFSGMRRRTH